MSSITYLSISSNAKLTTAASIRQRLDRLRQTHFTTRALKARTQRLLLARAATQHPTATLARRLTRVLRLLSRRRLPSESSPVTSLVLPRWRKWLPTRSSLSTTLKSAMKAMHHAYQSVRGSQFMSFITRRLQKSKSAKLLQRQKQRRVLGVLVRAIGICIRNLIRARRRIWLRQLAPGMARALIRELFQDESLRGYAVKVIRHRERERRRLCVQTIEHAWEAYRRRQQDLEVRKTRLLGVLSVACAQLTALEQHQHTYVATTSHVADLTHHSIMSSATQRLAVRLIQRVWRGYRARRRVHHMLDAKARRRLKLLQRERIRQARAALLSKTPVQEAEERFLRTRVQARTTPTPLLIDSQARVNMTHTRQSMLVPLLHHTPPRVSGLTGARILRVPFTKFQQIRERQARVNPNNLWVAIPIGFNTASNVNKQRNQGTLRATYDWLPAALLPRSTQLEPPISKSEHK